MYVLSWRTVSVLTRVLFWYLLPSLLRNSGNKHQNDPLVRAETIRQSSTYIILYIRDFPHYYQYICYGIDEACVSTHHTKNILYIKHGPLLHRYYGFYCDVFNDSYNCILNQLLLNINVQQ